MPSITALSSRNANLAAAANTIPGKIAISLCATAVVAAAAHVAIPLPFTPVPLTLQPLAVLGVGLALGPVAGFFTMVAYLAEAAIGLPVLSPAGPGGIAQILGPSGGFLMSYPLVAAIIGGLAQTLSSRASKFTSALVAGFCAVAVLLAFGAAWFSNYTHHSLYATWIGAVAPFLPGEIVKVFVAAGIYSALKRDTFHTPNRTDSIV
jgi:biotin transport system substrate-specific component